MASVPPQFTIRQLQSQDMAAVSLLWHDALPSSQPWNEPNSELRRKLDQRDDMIFVGELAGDIVATVVAGYDGIRGWIYRLAVATAWRGQGLGRRMLEAAEAALCEQGCPKVNLQVRADNADVIEFYQRCGYSTEDRASLGKRLVATRTADRTNQQSSNKTQPNETPTAIAPSKIDYQAEANLCAAEFIDVLHRSTLAARRPVGQPDTVAAMLENAQVIITARVADLLIGVSRAITDYAYCTYLSDLAVDEAYQGQGIGRELIRRTHEAAGVNTTLILLSAPQAKTYYPHIGMASHDSCWIRRNPDAANRKTETP